MNPEVKKIYDFIKKREDFYYGQLTGGKSPMTDIVCSAQASSYQMIRYFIEEKLDGDGK